MVQSVQYLYHKRENLSSDPQCPREKLGAVMYACNQAAGQTEATQWLTQYTAVLVSSEPLLQWETLSLKK